MKEVNQSVVVSQPVTLSWKATYTPQESSQSQDVVFRRYPQHNNSAVVLIGSVGFYIYQTVGRFPFCLSPFKPRITVHPVAESATAVTEPAITILNVTKEDEAFYWIEVNINDASVTSHTIFLTVLGNYDIFVCLHVYLYMCRFCRNVSKSKSKLNAIQSPSAGI